MTIDTQGFSAKELLYDIFQCQDMPIAYSTIINIFIKKSKK